MDKLIKPIRTLLGIEQGEIPAISTGEVAGAPVVVPAPRDEPSSTHISNFRCPERGEEFEIYVRTLEKDFRAYDPNFVIEKWLGSGGFCDVFLVPDVNIPGKGRRRAVLRVLRPTIYRTTRPEVNNSNIRLFLTEMGYNLFLSSQNAPHVVKMYDFGFFGRKAGEPRHLYMIMQYVEGEDIAVRWRRRPSDEKELVKRVVQVNQIAGIVGELHFRGIIHCDLKPTNILMQGDQPILTDFGSARWMHVSDAVGDMAMQVPGTQSYMSYEQLQGEYYRLDQRTDIFSLAVVLWQALTGKSPFAASTAEVSLGKIERGPKPPLSKAGPALSGIVEDALFQALSPNPQDRMSDIGDFAHDVLAGLGDPEDGAFSLRELVGQSSEDEETSEPAWGARHLPFYIRFPWAETAVVRLLTAALTFMVVRIALEPVLAYDATTTLTGALIGAAAAALWPPLGSALAGAATVAAVATTLATNMSFPLSGLTALALAFWWIVAGRRDHLASAALLLPAATPFPIAGVALAIYALEPFEALATGMAGYLFGTFFSLAVEAGFAATPLVYALAETFVRPEVWVVMLGCGFAALAGSAFMRQGSVGAGVLGQIVGCAVVIAGLIYAAHVENGGIGTAPDAPTVGCAVSLTLCMCVATALRGPLQWDQEGDEQ